LKAGRGRPAGGPERSVHKGRNELKRIVLGAMENRAWLSAAMIRHLAGYDWIRPLNYSLERYYKFGWLHRRGSWNAKPVLYRITRQGMLKLDWLRKVMP
jgi:hypothetical protein